MHVFGEHYRTIWRKQAATPTIQVIDQRKLPFAFEIVDLYTLEDVTRVIKDMTVRGAGLIGATAGYGMMLAAHQHHRAPLVDFRNVMNLAAQQLKATRPTAINLAWAVDCQLAAMSNCQSVDEAIIISEHTAQTIADKDAEACRQLGLHGLKLIEDISHRKNSEPVNILTHCNAGWLAFVDYGSATAPIYAAHDKGISVHVWVDETRPRNQGARLTAWELGQHGVPHHVIVDNAGGHLMQHGKVDMCIVGSDRTTYTGDVGNKIGTYLKALAAYDNGIPFYAALPSSTFDWHMRDGVREIPIEERGGDEVHTIEGMQSDGSIVEVRILPSSSPVVNYGFDVTPSRLVTGLITERGVCAANEEGIRALFPEKIL